MHDVGTPFHVAAQPPSTIGNVTIDRLTATGVYRAAASIESWSREPVARVVVRDSTFEFVGGFGPVWSDPAEAAAAYITAQSEEVKPPGINPRPLPVWGLYARHVASLNLSDVKLVIAKKDDRPAIIFDGVDELELDNLKCPIATPRPMVLNSVLNIAARGIPVVTPECVALTATSDAKEATATVHCETSGLAKVELKLDDKTTSRWTWLDAGKRVDVNFSDLPKRKPGGAYQIVCGSIRAELSDPSK
jgi:hypothetical protein